MDTPHLVIESDIFLRPQVRDYEDLPFRNLRDVQIKTLNGSSFVDLSTLDSQGPFKVQGLLSLSQVSKKRKADYESKGINVLSIEIPKITKWSLEYPETGGVIIWIMSDRSWYSVESVAPSYKEWWCPVFEKCNIWAAIFNFLQEPKPGRLKAPVEKVIRSVAKTLNITFAAAERNMRRHALFLDNQMKQASGSSENHGIAQSPVWTWLKGQREQMSGVTSDPSTGDAPGQSTSAASKLSSSRSDSNSTAVSVQKNADLTKAGTLESWLLTKQTQVSTLAALPGLADPPCAPSLTRKDSTASTATAVEAKIDKPAKPTKQATATSSRKPETQPSTKENKAPSTSARKKPSALTETKVESEAGPSRKPSSKSSRSGRSATSSRKRSRSTEATTSGVKHVALNPESTGSSARRPIKATPKTLVPKIKSLYADAAKNIHIVEFPTYKYPENGVWCCWLPGCKKQINVVNYDDNEDLVEAAVAEHIEEHYNAIWNKWTPARRKNYQQLVRKSEMRVRSWIDGNEDILKEQALMAMGTDFDFAKDDAIRVEKSPIQWPSFGSAMNSVKPSKDVSSMIRRPLLHILDGGGASEKERLFRLSQNVDNDAIFVEKKKQPRRSPTRMARARAPAPAPSAIPAKAPVKTDIMAIDKDEDEDEDKIKPSVPVPSTCAFSSLVQSDRTVGKSSSPSPRKSVGRASTAVPKPMTRHFLDLDSEEEEELIRLLSKMPTSPSGKGKQAADLTLPEERSPPNPYVTTVLPNDEPGIGASSLRPSPIGVAPTGIPTREPPIEGVLPPFLPILPTPRLHPMPVPSAPPAQWTCKSCTVIHMVEPGLSDTECDLCGAFRFSS